MAKKKGKKKKTQTISLLREVDKQLDHTYDSLMEEIQDMQCKLMIADQKAKKKARKKKNKSGKGYEYDYNKLRREARREVVGQMEGNNFLDRAIKFMEDITPVVISISRLIAALIVCILQIDGIKACISPETLKKLQNVYNKAMSIH